MRRKLQISFAALTFIMMAGSCGDATHQPATESARPAGTGGSTSASADTQGSHPQLGDTSVCPFSPEDVGEAVGAPMVELAGAAEGLCAFEAPRHSAKSEESRPLLIRVWLSDEGFTAAELAGAAESIDVCDIEEDDKGIFLATCNWSEDSHTLAPVAQAFIPVTGGNPPVWDISVIGGSGSEYRALSELVSIRTRLLSVLM